MTATLPFWLDEPYEARAPLAGDLRVEACVIGGGVGGLSCALSLAQRGVDTLVLERSTVAGGASGRNGGFLLAGMAAFYHEARERYGHGRARDLYAQTLEAQREIYALAQELGVADAVRRSGLLRVSASPEEAADVERQVAALNEDGFPAQLVERAALPEPLRRSFHNACLTDHDGALHPARWIKALAGAAERAGARICERTLVTGVGRREASAATARVDAGHVVVAADGALPALVPGVPIRARRLHMVATEALPQRLLDCPVYARYGFEYFQQTPDGRLLAGGFSDLDAYLSYTDRDEGNPAVWERIERYLAEDLGVDTPVTHRWVGTVGYSEDGLPVIGEHDGVHVAGGYSGHGNVLGYLAGKQLAERIAG